ncbi:MAG TPA: double-strand break repair protein AddB [Stellaceae bacterium]|nr:double-strand break repair protein AddB [Stellaceae bacterium]
MAFHTIPADLPFLDTLVTGILPRAGGDPLALTRVTILLPTRRAVRSLTEAFLRASAGRALLLPRMVPVGDLDAEDLAIGGADGDIDIPPALPPLRRQLLLAQLVLKWGEQSGAGPLTPGRAVPLARALADFLDAVQTARGDMATLDTLAPDKFAEHWQQVLAFLGIVTRHWPAMLAEAGALDPADQRNRVLAARIAAWEVVPPPETVIAAGLSGGIPVLADLIAAVARLPRGEIVLAGLDFDSAGMAAIAADATHPQHLHARLLARFGLIPEQIPRWPGCGATAAPPRRELVRAALVPAGETDRWRDMRKIGRDAIGNLRRLDCADAQEEAETIALIMRQALEAPDRTAALVTPDRALARRVAAELKRWNIDIDDSAGVPLDRTPPAVFLRLLLDAAMAGLAPLPLLALLKHPLAAGGLPPEIFRARVRQLERRSLRGARPAPGVAGLRRAIPPGDRDLADLVARLDTAIAPLIACLERSEIALADLVDAHTVAAETLAASRDASGADNLWREAAGETAAQFIAELRDAARNLPAVGGADYPALFEALIAGAVVRPRYGLHPRLAIWGLLEARLQRAEIMILGGLNEGVWPPQIESDAFLSRPMRQAFGLPPPEERIGVAAHDFAQALGAPTVWLTRAARVEGTPTVPSRWLLRLDTVLLAADPSEALKASLAAPTALLHWRARLDAPDRRRAIEQPKPRPPVAVRPRQLPVTQIEMLIRDPYTVYARTILRLRPLDPIDEAPDAAARGTFIHDSLDQFLREHAGALPGDATRRLLAIGAAKFAPFADRPELRAFWWPRFERVARWFVETEAARRGSLARIESEIEGRLAIAAPLGDFLLTAKADRIDRRHDGGLAIIDYKTGSLPRSLEWGLGYAPQLPLEAAMAEAGGFAGVAGKVTALEFWKLSGGDPPGEVRALAKSDAELRELIDAALPGLARLIAAYDDPATPYAAVPRSEFAPRYNDYAHLSRVKEWAAAEGGEE